MATLTIEGRKVTIDDAFKGLSPDEQNKAVEEIASSLKIQPQAAASPQSSGAALNATAGVNEGIYGTLGAPVDLMRGAMNLGIQGVNAATGSDIGAIPSDSFGGSQSIAGMMGAVHPALDPANTVAGNAGDRIARGAGQGVGFMMAPEAAVAGFARGGAIGADAAGKAAQVFGQSGSVPQAATNAAVGAASGAGAATGQELAPDPYKPLAGLAGGLVGGGLGVAGAAIPSAVRSGAGVVGELAAPMSAAGRERLAADQLRNSATDPAMLREKIDTMPGQMVPGSNPTTFQQTGDMGIGALERQSQTKFPDRFMQRRADQNAARVDAATGLQKTGAPEQVAKAVTQRLQQIDQQTQSILDRATQGAQDAAGAIGNGSSPETAGSTMRASLESARAQAKTQERALWDAVDPNGSLSLPARNARQQVAQLQKDLPRSARPPEGEEAAILGVVGGFDQVVPFRELTTAQGRLKEAMRAERIANGETQAYRRMAQLNSAIESDLTNGIKAEATREAVGVKLGGIRSENTIAGRLQAGDVKAGTAVFTPSGRRVETEFKVVDGNSLTHSGQSNFPAGLQPRDRSRAASELQVNRMAKDLQPERLGASSSASDGAPIIGPDGVVESGNGRVQAISRANQEGGQSAAAYRQYLESQGFKTDGMKNPVLVRVRKTPLSDAERVRFAQEANAPSTLGMSAGEQAATDAGRLSNDTLSLYRGGDLTAAQNRDFAKAFLRTVPEPGQEASFVTADGGLSLDGAQRMRNAVLHAAYEDAPLVAALAETGDENIRAFGRALTDISGEVAKLKAGIKAGRVDAKADVSKPLVEAASVVQNARRRGVKLPDAIAQEDAFSRTSSEAMSVLDVAYGDGLTGRLSRDRFDAIMQSVVTEAEQQTTDARLFGDTASIAEILEGARTRYGSGSQANSLAGDGGNLRTGIREGGNAAGGTGFGPQGSPASTESGGSRILDRPELTPNFDEASLGRLKAAREATSNRAGTFDNKTLGPMRRRPSTVSPYDMPASAVAARVFVPGPKGFDTVKTFRAAAGDHTAYKALQDYAIDRLRNNAMRPDGTLDPAKVQSFRRSHSDALRAFPELDQSFANAAAASETMGIVASQRKAALDEAQKGALKPFLGSDNPEDVTRAVGSIFGRQDANQRMAQLRGAIGTNAEAKAGLRKAVADYVTGRFIGNTEAATSGVGTMKSDQFQNFVKQNRPALKVAGFSDKELATMDRIVQDLQRSNRSIASVKIPGQSNTAQDIIATRKGEAAQTILRRITSAASGGGGYIAGGPLTAIAGWVGSEVVGAMRQAGLQTVDQLVADAMLNPARAKALLSIPAAKAEASSMKALAAMYRRAAAASAASTARDTHHRPMEITVTPLPEDQRTGLPSNERSGRLSDLGAMQ